MTAATHKDPPKGKPLSVLVADDEEDTVKMLAVILEDEGYVVHTVTHGALVMEAVKRFEPEACILDIEMPGANGYTLARAICQKHPVDRPLLIAISGKWTTQTDKLLAKSVGFDHFLLKPAEPAAVVAILERIGERGRDKS